MDNKRLIIALVLSFAVLFAWQTFFAPQPEPQPAKTNATTATPTAPKGMTDASAKTVAAAKVKAAQDFTPTKGKEVKVDTPLYTAVFNSQGGVLQKFVLKKYRQTIEPNSPLVDMLNNDAAAKGSLGLIITKKGKEVHTWHSTKWKYDGGDLSVTDKPASLTFVGEAGGFRLERKLTFDPATYLITEDVTVTNITGTGVEGSLSFTAAVADITGEDNSYDPTRIAYLNDNGRDEMSDREDLAKEGLSASGGVKWGAVESNYFMFAIAPASDKTSLFAGFQSGVFRLAVQEVATFMPNVAKTLKTSYFIGPCERDMLAKMPNELEKAVDFGWFDILAKPLLIAMNFLYKYVHNYGIAIIILTIFIKLLFWPLSQKSYESMEQMKKLQPMITKLREKYGDDKQRIQQETMALYKTYKVNPAGGCLPMIIQIPVFFGLYKALMGAIELRHAPFIEYLPFTDIIWLADLSAKDPFYITPLIMGATMFLQQKMTPSAGDPTQQKIMLIMPVVFTFMFLQFPAGLVIYWLLNNVLSIGQQWLLIRKNKSSITA